MINKEKIQFLKAEPPKSCCLVDYYQELLEKVGSIQYHYGDYMTTEPINCDEELKRIASADWDLCCALLTMLFREDHFAQYGSFDKRCEKGDVQRIIDRMIFLLEQKDENIKRRLAGRATKEHRQPILIPHFTCHSLSHTFCTRFCENETDLKIIQEIMGHADIGTTMNIYNEATKERKQASFPRLEGKIKIC